MSGSRPQPRLRRRLLRLVPMLVAIALLALLLPKLDLGRVLRVIRDADWRLVALAVLVNLVANVPCRVMRWWTLLRPLPRKPVSRGDRGPTFGELLSLTLASYATNNLLPARAGEALRTVQPHRRHGYPIGSTVASQLMEKLVEAASMALLGLPMVLLAHATPEVRWPLGIFVGATLAGVLLVLVVAHRAPLEADTGPVEKAAAEDVAAARETRRPLGERLRALGHSARLRGKAFLRRLAQAVRLMNSPHVWLQSLLWSWGSDIADVATIGLCLYAVGVHLGVPAWCVVFLAVNLAIMIPSTPGQVGVLEAGAVLALGTLGVGRGEALAFELLYHAANVIPVTLAGVIALRRQWRSPEPERV